MERSYTIPNITIPLVLDSLINYVENNLQLNKQRYNVVPSVCSIRPRELGVEMGLDNGLSRLYSTLIGRYLAKLLIHVHAEYKQIDASRGKKLRIYDPKRVVEKLKSVRKSEELQKVSYFVTYL